LELRYEDDDVAGETARWETVEEEGTTEWRQDKGETVVTGGTRSGEWHVVWERGEIEVKRY